jgi:polysaccharide biosynthesis protein PslE
LAQQASGLKGQLNSLENDLRVLKNATGLAAPTEQRQILVTQIGRLQDELKTAQATAVATEAEVHALSARIAELQDTQTLSRAAGVPNVAADGMQQQLYTLQLKEKELASRQTDQNVELKLVRAQIASAKAVLDAVPTSRTQTTTGPNRTYEELRLNQLRRESELASLKAKEQTLTAQLADSRQQLEKLNDNQLRIAQIEREIQIRDASYRKYADGLEQSRIDESLERQRISNINVAQPPTAGSEPVWPQTRLMLFLGFVVALFGGVALAFAMEYVDHSLKTAEEIESRLNLPVLVSIPQMRPSQMAHSIYRG